MNGVEWTPEMLDTLRTMRKERRPLFECAARIGVAYSTTVRMARKLGLAQRMNRGSIPSWKLPQLKP